MPEREASIEEDAACVRTINSAGDPAVREECFRRLMGKYWKLIAISVTNKLGDLLEAEDITQETFFRAFRSLGSLSEPAAFLGWILRIAQNLVRDRIRGRRSMVSLEVLGDAVERAASAAGRPEIPDFERDLEAAEETEQVMKALAELPEMYREVISLKYLQGLDGKAMARLLGEPEGTIRNRLFRALEKLRSRLEQRRAHKS